MTEKHDTAKATKHQKRSPKGSPKPRKKRNIDTPEGDFYPTYPWKTRALLDHEPFEGAIWDPACGDGRMVEVFRNYGFETHASDVTDRGYGDVGIDFLQTNRPADNIVTNPPYYLAEAFVHHGLWLVRRKLALLLRLDFEETLDRYYTIFAVKPYTRKWIFAERPTFYPKNLEPRSRGSTGYGWFVWDKDDPYRCQTAWLTPGYDPDGAVYKGKFKPSRWPDYA